MPDLIVTHGSRIHPPKSPWRGLSYRQLLLKRRQDFEIEPVDLPADNRVNGEVEAFVNSGRWMVECGDCYTAVLVDPDDLRFYCPGCATSGFWKRIVMPMERGEIERLLLLRPGWQANAPHRNWLPDETVQDLVQENLVHGVEV